MQQFQAILIFYKPYFLWSCAINTIIISFNPHFVPLLLTKLMLTVFLWYLMNETHGKRKLIFYKNLGISTFRLFATLFLIDIFITIIFLQFITEFI